MKSLFIPKLVISIRQKMENIKDIVMPFKILKERISQAEIISIKKNSADIYTYVCQKMISIDEHHQQKVKNKLAAELWLNAHPFHEWVTAKIQP
jgi:hypothetical protein